MAHAVPFRASIGLFVRIASKYIISVRLDVSNVSGGEEKIRAARCVFTQHAARYGMIADDTNV